MQGKVLLAYDLAERVIIDYAIDEREMSVSIEQGMRME